jgi:hypothetical protein
MEPDVAKYGDKVFGSQLVLTSFAMRWRKCNGLVLRQTINAHVKEAAHLQTQNGE